MPSFVSEPPRQTELYGEFDVCVLGGGPAGLAAAASAARHGARTLLVERYGFLGGMGTAGGVTNFAGLYGKRGGEWVRVVRGVADELLDRIDQLGGLNAPQDGLADRIRVRSYDVSAYKLAADALMQSAGVQLLFHAWAAGCVMRQGLVDTLLCETKSGRRAVRAKVFVDCSGDADLAAWSGVPFDYGDGSGGALFPTLMFRVGGVQADAALAAVGELGRMDQLMAEHASTYRFARQGAIVRPQKDPSQWRVNVTQIRNAQGLAMNAIDAAELTQGELDGRQQVHEYWRFLREQVPGFGACHLIEIAPQVGIRESRRIHGRYRLTGEDVTDGARFEDAIGVNAWPMELHVDGRVEWQFARSDPAWNQLPWRMVLPQAVPNLLVAGRCASMTHEGQSAARASGACFVMGQAAGTAAAMAVRSSRLAPDIDVGALQAVLRRDGVFLDDGADR
jgi:hypothetical protein